MLRSRREGDWRRTLDVVNRLMRNLSKETEPQNLVRMYGEAVDQVFPIDHYIALSRRGLEAPYFRITRNSWWKENINPWTERDRLPVLSGGLLGEWAYLDAPLVLQDFSIPEFDQHYELLKDVRSALVMPQFDHGEGLNVSALLWERPGAIDEEQVAFMHWQGNLFGRATHNLVLRRELSAAYEALDRELQVVGEIQRSLLPSELPRIETMELAAHYRTSQRAGGDYYDLFPMPEDRWGLCIADVSGHGTPAAVMMAVTHAIAHWPPPESAAAESTATMMSRLNRTLHEHYTHGNGTFVTAFYGVYDAKTRELRYSNAGHNPPRLMRGGDVRGLIEASSLPLGILPAVEYSEAKVQLEPGDLLVLYTDGITEAFDSRRRLFGLERLDEVLRRSRNRGTDVVADVMAAVDQHAGGTAPSDDQTLLAAQVR